MKKLLASLAAVSVVTIGCGAGPKCTDSASENAFISGCMNGGATYAECSCVFSELADKYECPDFGNATVTELQGIVNRCQ